ncbi:MAG: polysaccharide deacetylase [Lachnospiraceae bacterium]|nr:polysaccharide deacetylase [Lachnospiraceae bacterium]
MIEKQMAQEDKQQKRSRVWKRYAVILLLLLVLIPSSFSVILMFQMAGLRSAVKELQSEVRMWKSGSNQEAFVETVRIGEDVEIFEDEATADIIALENKLIWDDIEQNAQDWNSDSGIRRVYLTFDDGPSSNTDKILDILNEYGVKATFFVCGNERYMEEYQRIADEGHTLGMHSYSHKFREIYQSTEAFLDDMNRLHDYLYEVTGVDSKIVRFPGGSSNTICEKDVMQDLIAYLSQEGMPYFDWNVSSGDAASSYISAERIAKNVLDNVWKYDSVIILMHDASNKDTTVEALPMIIEKILESEDTVLLPITEDTSPIQHVQAN